MSSWSSPSRRLTATPTSVVLVSEWINLPPLLLVCRVEDAAFAVNHALLTIAKNSKRGTAPAPRYGVLSFVFSLDGYFRKNFGLAGVEHDKERRFRFDGKRIFPMEKLGKSGWADRHRPPWSSCGRGPSYSTILNPPPYSSNLNA